MKLNKLVMALGLGMALVAGSVNAANPSQGHGTVTFTGSIIDAPCSITPETVDQIVPLGSISNASLKNGGRSSSKSFKISLENCTTETINTVTTTFTGAKSSITGGDGLLGIEGSAKGAGIAITDGGGNKIKLGTPSPAVALHDGSNDLNFAAYLQGDTGPDAVVPGDFTGIANFQLTYQ
ncbi:fimbrial protein [Photorhabdus khanii]|uniref:Fimbria A protein n=1 Tax=Photorhabdus khanii subsp. guanajuatensis TaxID=2100166 RepID=A0A4R4JSB7_9GAMM|nr:fimbrial protein [Photorhabdus khanii]TDB56866.1 fimbria A protein [Photorhabdus khanii subsp. guanajuatensis]